MGHGKPLKDLPQENGELQQLPFLDCVHHVDLQLLQGPVNVKVLSI